MLFLQNGKRSNKLPVLLLHSYTRYMASSSGLFHWLFTFFTFNTKDCHFWFHSIDNDTFFIQNHILLLLKLHLYITRNYVFLSHNNFLIDISKIKKLERRVAVSNRNKCERFRKKWHRIENKIPQDLIRNKQKNQLFKNL